MARWQDVVDSAPEFARQAQALFDAHTHKTMATLRKDGSPRISGIEANFSDGEAWLGMMTGSLKLADVRRDPRIALHSGSDDPGEGGLGWKGDAKLSGRAIEVTDPERLQSMGNGEEVDGSLFRIDIDEVVVTTLDDPPTQLVISLWRLDRPLQVTKRA